MHERVATLHGSISVESTPGEGTTITTVINTTSGVLR